LATAEEWANAVIDSSFRDAADEDYVAARATYRLRLTHAFLWNALQTVEKYIKAILLYNRRPTGDLGHDVARGFASVLEIKDIPWAFPADIQLFVDYINAEGPNRYRGRPSLLRDDALLGLDRTAWHLRRHCFAFGGASRDATKFAEDIAALPADGLGQRLTFRLPGGRLERILDTPSEARKHLVWKNFWYGTRRRRIIKSFPHRWSWSRPVIFMRPEAYVVLRDLMLFDKDVRSHFDHILELGPKQ
jgi:hypothetical protein